MAKIRASKSGGGGGGGSAYEINFAHKTSNANTIYYSASELSSGGVSSYVEPVINTITASGNGGVFDTTIQLSSSLSVRVHSGGYNHDYILVDVIKNGVTVSTDNHANLPVLGSTARRLDLVYAFNFTVFA